MKKILNFRTTELISLIPKPIAHTELGYLYFFRAHLLFYPTCIYALIKEKQFENLF